MLTEFSPGRYQLHDLARQHARALAAEDNYSDMAAFWMELILTIGLVSVILGTASGDLFTEGYEPGKS